MDDIPAEVVAEFEADLDTQMESWTDAVRERLEEVGPPEKTADYPPEWDEPIPD